MNRTMCVSAFAALTVALSVGMKAQQPTSSSRTSQPTGNVTVTGCLQGDSASAGAAATAPAGSTSASANRFVLANAKIATGAGGAPAATAGAEPPASRPGTASSMPAAGSSYVLEGDSVELGKHLGHQVEVTGRIDSSASAGSSAGTTGSTSPAPATGSSTASKSSSAEKLLVQSVRMIAASCTSS